MLDYKKMYLDLFSQVEDAVNLLISAQEQAEETYVNDTDDAPPEHSDDSSAR